MPSHDGDERPGTLGARRASNSSSARVAAPTASVGQMGLAQSREELPQQAEEPCRRQREPEQGAELAGDDADGDAVEVAGQNRPGEEIGEETQTCEPGRNAEDTGDHGQRCGQRHVSRRIRPASGATTAATIAQVAASGATINCRDEPNRAYATSGRRLAYNP